MMKGNKMDGYYAGSTSLMGLAHREGGRVPLSQRRSPRLDASPHPPADRPDQLQKAHAEPGRPTSDKSYYVNLDRLCNYSAHNNLQETFRRSMLSTQKNAPKNAARHIRTARAATRRTRPPPELKTRNRPRWRRPSYQRNCQLVGISESRPSLSDMG